MDNTAFRIFFAVVFGLLGAGILLTDLLQRAGVSWSGVGVNHAIAFMLAGLGGHLMFGRK